MESDGLGIILVPSQQLGECYNTVLTLDDISRYIA